MLVQDLILLKKRKSRSFIKKQNIKYIAIKEAFLGDSPDEIIISIKLIILLKK